MKPKRVTRRRGGGEVPWDAAGEGFRADLIVENRVIAELKSVERLASVHGKQLLTWLKVTNVPVGCASTSAPPPCKKGCNASSTAFRFRVSA